MLTGIKDVDRLIIVKLNDRDILEYCKISKYANRKVCDENFFHNLVINRYQNTIKYKDSVKLRNWKNHFLTVVYYIDRLKTVYNLNLQELKNEVSPEMEYLARSFTPTYRKYSKEQALIWASEKGHLSVVQYLVEDNANIHWYDDEALRNATWKGHLPVVKYLVEYKADIHAVDDLALIWASENEHLEVVKYLVEHNANIHTHNDYILRNANEKGHSHMVKYLESLQ